MRIKAVCVESIVGWEMRGVRGRQGRAGGAYIYMCPLRRLRDGSGGVWRDVAGEQGVGRYGE